MFSNLVIQRKYYLVSKVFRVYSLIWIEHWISVPKVIGSIPIKRKLLFGFNKSK